MNLKTIFLGVACATTLVACGGGKAEIKKADFDKITENAKNKHGGYKTVNVTAHYEKSVNGKVEEKKDGQGVFSIDEENPWEDIGLTVVPNYKVTTKTDIDEVDGAVCGFYNYCSIYVAKLIITDIEKEEPLNIKYYKNPLGLNFDYAGVPAEVEYGNNDYIANKLVASFTEDQIKTSVICEFKGTDFVTPPQR